MSEFAKTRAEAKVGDQIYVYDRQAPLYVDGEYKGRGLWCVASVNKIADVYIETDKGRYRLEDGEEGTRTDYPSYRSAFGSVEHEDEVWRLARHRIADAVLRLDERRVLKQIAELVGVDKDEQT
jgi:hypothetical protein